jgi:hypothetical protein
VAETALDLEQAAENNSEGSPLNAFAAVTVDKQIEDLTKQIASLEQELIRLNTNFRIECTGVGKWKRWRLFAYNLGGSGTCVAGSASIAATRWHYSRNSSAMSIPTAVAGPTCLLIGHCIVLTGVLAETAFDFVHDRSVRRKGLDLKTTHRRVLEIKSTVDRLMAQRQALLPEHQSVARSCANGEQPESTAIDHEIARAQGKVLQDLQALALNEYAQFYGRAHNYFAARRTNNILALTAASTGGFGGSLPGMISAAERRPRVVGAGGIGFPISGAIITASPILVKLMGDRAGKNANKSIEAELKTAKVSSLRQFDEDRNRLERLVSQAQSSENEKLPDVKRRLAAYSRHSLLFAAQAQMAAREKASADRELAERMMFATAVGGSKISWGVNLANAGFGFRRQSILQVAQGAAGPTLVTSPTPGNLFTKRVAIGATTYLPSTSFWLIDTLQNRIRGELRERDLVRQKIHPSILLKERQDLVREIDEGLNY